MDDSLASRASRITPQEWRVIALSIEGVSPGSACEALGIALGTLESHKQAIRRKLGIPKGQRFEAFVRAHFAEGVQIPEKRERREVSKENADRRVRWLLRITLDELSEVGMSAGLRAQLLTQTVERMSGGDIAEARSEVEELERIGAELIQLHDQAITRIRARGADVSSLERKP